MKLLVHAYNVSTNSQNLRFPLTSPKKKGTIKFYFDFKKKKKKKKKKKMMQEMSTVYTPNLSPFGIFSIIVAFITSDYNFRLRRRQEMANNYVH